MYKTVLAYHKCPGKGGATYVFERSDLLQSERRSSCDQWANKGERSWNLQSSWNEPILLDMRE